MKKQIARLADRPQDYQRLGIQPGRAAVWEDGVRTEGKRGEFEWWYFDAKLDGGASLVLDYHTTPLAHLKNEYAPFAKLSLTYPDGKEIVDVVWATAAQSSFSKEKCDFRIGACTFSGDLKTYTICHHSEKVHAEIKLISKANPWRPETGHFLFGDQYYFAWLPTVPEGIVEVTITHDGITEHFTGTGYHDHNWGNIPMNMLMHHWYWGRAKIGEYQAITCYITSLKKYDYVHFPIFMLSKNGELLCDDGKKLRYAQSDPIFDEVTGKHIHRNLVYDYEDGAERYRIRYRMENHIERLNAENSMKLTGLPPFVATVMKLLGVDPSYDRVCGTATLERFADGVPVETITAPALWELMYLANDADV